MEQSRIAVSQTPSGANASVRAKGTARTSAGEVSPQDPAAHGGFLALMAALDQAPAVDAAVAGLSSDASDSALSLVQSSDPVALMSMQGLWGVGEGRVGTYRSPQVDDGMARSSGLSWAADFAGGGLVAQTTALDRFGDIKDGDNASALLTAQGRPALSRATTASLQRNDIPGSPSSGLSVKGASVEPSRIPIAAAIDPSQVGGAPTSISGLRDPVAVLGNAMQGLSTFPGLLGEVGVDGASVAAIALGAADTGRSGEASQRGDQGDARNGSEGFTAGTAESNAPISLDAPSLEPFTPLGADEALAEQVTYWVNQKVQNAEMTLSKDGQPVEVSVTLSGNEAHVAFRSDQEQTRQLLDASMAQLSEMLRGQGLMLSGASVSTSDRGGRPSEGQQAQERGSRTGQSKVVAAPGVVGGGASGSGGRSAVDVFV